MTIHMLLGAGGALVAILVNSITVTYFIGTSRWCKEVCETYRLPPQLAQQSTRLKRSTFPWAVLGILSVIAVVALGAAADPSGANHEPRVALRPAALRRRDGHASRRRRLVLGADQSYRRQLRA